jgi:exocyst complex protein 7
VRPVIVSTNIPPSYHSADIDKALIKIDEIASNQEGIAAEEVLILRGYVVHPAEVDPLLQRSISPQPGLFNVYQDALGRLNATIAFKDSDRDSRDTVRSSFTRV